MTKTYSVTNLIVEDEILMDKLYKATHEVIADMKGEGPEEAPEPEPKDEGYSYTRALATDPYIMRKINSLIKGIISEMAKDTVGDTTS